MRCSTSMVSYTRRIAVDKHDSWCSYPIGAPCRKFSTDGTQLGAEIAHQMGTTSEAEIVLMGRAGAQPFESDVAAEQADWDADG